MSVQPKPNINPEEYPVKERVADYKSEYYKGEIFAFADVSRNHNLIAGNIYSILHQQLRNQSWEVYPSDMRVKVNKTGLYTYPDVVVCGNPQFEDDKDDILLNPIVLIEVLSPSTQNYDRGIKFEHYRTISSLSDYLLVAQDKIHIGHYVQQSDRSWLFSEFKTAKDKLKI